MLGNGYKKIEIARVIGVDKSTVTRKIKRNADGRNGVYRYGLARHKAEDRRRTKPHAVVLTPEVAAYIERRLSHSMAARADFRMSEAGGSWLACPPLPCLTKELHLQLKSTFHKIVKVRKN